MSCFFVYHIIPYISQVVDICALALDVWQGHHYLAETCSFELEGTVTLQTSENALLSQMQRVSTKKKNPKQTKSVPPLCINRSMSFGTQQSQHYSNETRVDGADVCLAAAPGEPSLLHRLSED